MNNYKMRHSYKLDYLFSIKIYPVINSCMKEQFENILVIPITFFVSHFDISGKDIKDEQSENNEYISVILLVFQLDI